MSRTLIQTAAEWGVQGLILFVGFLVVTFWSLHRVRKESSGPDWFYYRSLAIELGLIGTLVAGVFSVRFYGESIYWFAALSVVLRRMPRHPGDTKAAPTADPSAAEPLSTVRTGPVARAAERPRELTTAEQK